QGGRLVYLEHVAHPEGSWGFIVQRLLDPLWSYTFCGCHVTRRQGHVLKNAGFDRIELTEVHLSVPIVMSPHVYGFAQLSQSSYFPTILSRTTFAMGRLIDLAEDAFLYSLVMVGFVFLVPLKLSEKFREAYFARFLYPTAIYVMKNRMDGIRRRVISQLNELESHDDELKQEGAIRVLEVGAGFGANFEHITRKVRYLGVEPNQEFDDAFLVNLKKNPNVEMERWIHGRAEDMSDVADSTVDVVLFTYLLCSVNEVQKVLEECKRVLVKGGRLVFLEHVAQPEGSWGSTVQKLLDPLWSLVFCGCHVTRRTGNVLAKAGFEQLQLTEEFVPIPFVISPHVYGYAIMGDYQPMPRPCPPEEEQPRRRRYSGNHLAEHERQAILRLGCWSCNGAQ
ncbi:unnamed protein product, partial [Ixodes hexagonus]